MTDHTSDRRGFITGIAAGLVGALFALRGAERAEAAAATTPRKLRHVVGRGSRAESTRAVIAEVRPKRGVIESCWVYVENGIGGNYWAQIEVGRTPDGDGIVNWELAYWRESELD
jgi:hypothetical protein